MAHRSNKPNPIPASQPLTVPGKDEMNLAEFPLARLGRNDTRKVIEYHGQIIEKDGSVLEQTWVVSGSAKFGLPTEFAERVLIALMALTAEQNFDERKVEFTPYRILKMLNMTTGNVNYKAIKKALQQLVGVTIYSEGSFWDKANARRVTTEKGFHLLDDFWLKSMKGSDGGAEEVSAYVVWGERFWENFKAGYIKNLDVTFYYSLESTLARRLFRFLDKRMHYRNEYQIDVFDLAARLGMKEYAYPSELVKKLKPAFNELIARNYLASAEPIKVGKFTCIKFVRMGAMQILQASLWDEDAYQGAEGDVVGRGEAQALPAEQGDVESREERTAALLARFQTPALLQQAWRDLLRELAETMPAESYRMIGDSLLLEIEGGAAVVAVNPVNRDWIERQMGRKILTTLSVLLGERVREITFLALG